MSKRPRKPSQMLYTSAQFRPYAIALGQLALAWNGLHVRLCLSFCTAMGGGYSNAFLAVWHAVTSDRQQREMLKSALTSHLEPRLSKRFIDDINWVCERADRIEEERNNALHSPLWAIPGTTGAKSVVPLFGLGHKRAKRLAGKDLLVEFRLCRDRAMILDGFVSSIEFALARSAGLAPRPWPERPSWPVHQPPKKQSLRPREHKAKHLRPPRSSRR